MPATFSLSDSPRVRYATGAMLYFAQGIPQGLLGIAIPAWLASQGMGAAEIASYLAATQDVAVDGMAIDLTPINEQGRLNASMSFGKAIGWRATAAVSGVLLVTVGMKVTAILAASVSALVLFAFVFVLERKGERTLPWAHGEARSRLVETGPF